MVGLIVVLAFLGHDASMALAARGPGAPATPTLGAEGGDQEGATGRRTRHPEPVGRCTTARSVVQPCPDGLPDAAAGDAARLVSDRLLASPVPGRSVEPGCSPGSRRAAFQVYLL